MVRRCGATARSSARAINAGGISAQTICNRALAGSGRGRAASICPARTAVHPAAKRRQAKGCTGLAISASAAGQAGSIGRPTPPRRFTSASAKAGRARPPTSTISAGSASVSAAGVIQPATSATSASTSPSGTVDNRRWRRAGARAPASASAVATSASGGAQTSGTSGQTSASVRPMSQSSASGPAGHGAWRWAQPPGTAAT